jgi:hypothetical protein
MDVNPVALDTSGGIAPQEPPFDSPLLAAESRVLGAFSDLPEIPDVEIGTIETPR